MSVSRRSFIKGLTVAGAVATIPLEVDAREPHKPGPDDVGMLYDATLCIGCRACVTKCREVNELPAEKRDFDGAPYDAPIDLSENTFNIIKLYKNGQQQAFVKKQCMHCVDPACVSVCMAGALHKMDNGVVAYNEKRCVGCRYCQIACAFEVPKFNWHSPFPKIVKCEMCRHREDGPACAECCPREAVKYGNYAALLDEARARIKHEPDRYFPKIYGETDGGGTHVLYLSPENVPFEKLGLPKLTDEPLPQLSETVQHRLYQGFIAPTVLYGLLMYAQFKHRKSEESEGREKKEDGHE